jgi:hypothetical protein
MPRLALISGDEEPEEPREDVSEPLRRVGLERRTT